MYPPSSGEYAGFGAIPSGTWAGETIGFVMILVRDAHLCKPMTNIYACSSPG
jgi:hypothetical protein